MSGGEMLIPILVPLGAFAMVFGIVYLRTRENMALIEKGKDPRSPRPYRSLKTGLLFLGAGIGLLLAYLIDSNTGNSRGFHHDGSEALYFSLIAVGGGLGLVASYAIERKAMVRGEDTE
ncbi:MAG TPA: DUF6249 domain-containing protein [Flavisolibacter sp.]|nr:DUF6249 domain-containing protein [Flavisolibacter sp.]